MNCTPTIEPIIIDPAKHATRLTTTLNRLKEADACANRYEHLLKQLGGLSFDHDAPINLLTILEHNGVEDCLWALCATAENCDVVARLMAADFAESVLPLFERKYPNDLRPRAAINAARAFAIGRIDSGAWDAARAAAWDAARAAIWDASNRDTIWDASRAATRAASLDAARDAAWAASTDAVWDAVRIAARAVTTAVTAAATRAATRAAQAAIIRRYLLP